MLGYSFFDSIMNLALCKTFSANAFNFFYVNSLISSRLGNFLLNISSNYVLPRRERCFWCCRTIFRDCLGAELLLSFLIDCFITVSITA